MHVGWVAARIGSLASSTVAAGRSFKMASWGVPGLAGVAAAEKVASKRKEGTAGAAHPAHLRDAAWDGEAGGGSGECRSVPPQQRHSEVTVASRWYHSGVAAVPYYQHLGGLGELVLCLAVLRQTCRGMSHAWTGHARGKGQGRVMHG